MPRMYRLFTMLIVTGMLLAGILQPSSLRPVSAQADCQAFPETGKSVCGRFLQYWNTHGGLAQQGFPISNVLGEVSPTDGKLYTVQYFERAVFEYHPENAVPNDILLSLLGAFRFRETYPNGPSGQVADVSPPNQTFPETGKTVGGFFYNYWKTHGGLAQQGLPISNTFIERSDLDGKSYLVQYFERAVFELHTEVVSGPPVLLSQLGTFRYRVQVATNSWVAPPYAVPPATVAVNPTATPVVLGSPPKELNAFADYIIAKYPRLGSCNLSYDTTFASIISKTRVVSLEMNAATDACVRQNATKADVQQWATAVYRDAQSAFGGDDFFVDLTRTGYTQNPCYSCDDQCYTVSDDYSAAKGGWYYSTRIGAAIQISGTRIVYNCASR